MNPCRFEIDGNPGQEMMVRTGGRRQDKICLFNSSRVAPACTLNYYRKVYSLSIIEGTRIHAKTTRGRSCVQVDVPLLPVLCTVYFRPVVLSSLRTLRRTTRFGGTTPFGDHSTIRRLSRGHTGGGKHRDFFASYL